LASSKILKMGVTFPNFVITASLSVPQKSCGAPPNYTKSGRPIHGCAKSLCPISTINGGHVSGNGIALDVVQQNGGEFHVFTFTGDLTGLPVPEPTTAVLLIAAVYAASASRVVRSGGNRSK